MKLKGRIVWAGKVPGMDHANGNFGKRFGNSFKATKQKIGGNDQRFNSSSHLVFEFFIKLVGLVVETPEPPITIFSAGKDFDIASGFPNRSRSDGVKSVVVAVISIAVIIVLVVIERRRIDLGKKL